MPDDVKLGEIVDSRYQIKKLLGDGRLGKVYFARDILKNRDIAMKVFRETINLDRDRSLFEREFEALRNLNHPGVVEVYERGENYFTMEYISGTPVSQIDKEDVTRIFEIGVDIARALDYIHRQGVIHRDLKPENIHLTEDAHVKILDFGFAIAFRSGQQQIAGTLNYMSPEAIRGFELDPRADIYSLGIILYELLSGRLPFKSLDIHTTVVKQVEMIPPLPSEFNPNVTPGFESIIMKAIAKSPDQRFQSASELLEAMIKLAGKAEFQKIKIERGRSFLNNPKFAGRKRESKKIFQAYQKAIQGQGEFIVIHGENGVGKSRLLREISQQWKSENIYHVHLICDNGINAAFAAFSQVIYQYFKHLEKNEPEALAPLSSKWGSILLPIIPALTHETYMQEVSPETAISKENLRQQLYYLFIDISKKNPLVILIDNLQWLDRESCYLLLFLVQEIREEKIFICGTYQKSDLGEKQFYKVFARLQEKNLCKEILLKSLSHENLKTLIASMMDRERVEGEILDRIFEVSLGIPLLAEETVKNMADDGLIYRKGGIWQLEIDDLRKIRRPGQLEESLIEKYENMNSESALILNIASIIMRPFPISILPAISQIEDKIVLSQIVAYLTSESFLVKTREEEEYIHIGSSKLAELLYEKIPHKTRQLLHEEIAKAFEKLSNAEDYIQDIAHHYRHTNNRRKTLYYLILAGDSYQKQYNYSQSVNYYKNALNIARQKKSSGTQILELHQKLGQAHVYMAEYSTALKYYERGIELAEGKASPENFYKGIGELYYEKGEFGKALRYFRILLTNLRKKDKDISEELSWTAAIHIEIGDYEEADILLKEALSFAKANKRKKQQARVYHLLAEIHFMRGYWANAMNYHLRALDLIHKLDEKKLRAEICVGLARTYIQKGLLGRGYKYLEDALYHADLIGDQTLKMMVQLHFGFLFEYSGDLNRAIELYSDCLDISQDLEIQIGEAYACMHLGRNMHLNEKITETFEYLQRSIALFTELNIAWGIGESNLLLGEAYIAQGEYGQALKTLAISEQAFVSIRTRWRLASIYSALAEVYQKQGKIERANKSLNKALKIAKRYDDEIMLGKIHTKYALFCAEKKLNPEALEHFVSAIIFLQKTTCIPALSDTYYAYGRALLAFERSGDRGFVKVAIHQLEKAQDLYAKAGLKSQMNKTIHLIKECEREKTETVHKRDLAVKLREFGRDISEFERESKRILETLTEEIIEEMGEDMQREEIMAELEKRVAAVKNTLNERLENLQDQNNELLSQVEGLKAERESFLTLQKISNTINSVLDSQKLLNMVMDMVIEELRAERGFVVLIDEGEGLNFKAARNIDKEELSKQDFKLSRSIVRKVIKTGEPVLTSDAQADGRFQSESITDLKLRAILCVPFKIKERVIGAVYVDNRFVSGLFSERDLDFLSAFSNQAAIAIENAFLYEELVEKQRMEQELSIAARIQGGLLPKTLPQAPGLEVYGRMIPAREVGGDYYDFIMSPDNSALSIVIGDVSGKGIPAGLVMVMARLILHHFIRDNKFSTKKTLLAANRLLKDNTEAFIFMSMILARWDIASQRLIYTGAGHENIIVCRTKDKKLEVFPAGGVVLGVKDVIDNLLEEKELILERGDSVIFYTDGVTECVSKSGSMLELDGFLQMVSKHVGKSPDAMALSLIEDLQTYMGGAKQYDDITLTIARKL